MQKYKKPVFTRKDLGFNPTVNSLSIPVRTIILTNKYETVGDDLLPLEQELEKTAYTKFYSSSERRKLRNNLSPRSKELLLWIMDEIEYNEDYLWINKDRYMEELRIKSTNTYKEALNELIRYAFLATTVIKDVFWINPDFFFKGDRVKMFSQNVDKQ